MSRFRTVWGKQGPPGTGLTSGEKTTINSRLTALEGDIGDIPDSIGDMTDVDLSGISSGDFLQWDGSALVSVSPSVTVPFSIPLVADGGSSAPGTGLKATVWVPFSSTITSWRINNDVAGSIEWDIWVNGTSIVGSAHPKSSNAKSASSSSLTGWTTSFPGTTAFEFFINSASTLTLSSLNLMMSRTITLGS